MKQRWLRILLVVLGTIFTGLGILGIFIPVLPTTPFLLLAAACYARSSVKFHNWLLNNKLFGDYLRNYRERKAIPLKVKLLTTVLLWLTIGASVVFVVESVFFKVFLIFIAVIVSIHILSLGTLRN